MKNYTDMSLPPNFALLQIEAFIDGWCAAHDLHVIQYDNLKKYAGCVQWNLEHKGKKGTLEITLWHSSSKIWFSCKERHTHRWINESVKAVKYALHNYFIKINVPLHH